MKLGNIYDTIYRISGFEAKFGLIVNSSKPQTNSRYKQTKLFETIPMTEKGLINVNFNTYSNKFVILESKTWDDQISSISGSKFVVPGSMFIELRYAINKAKEWLTNKNYGFLFVKNSNGDVVSLGKLPKDLPTIVRNDNTRLTLSPAIYTENGVKYEGVSMYTESTTIRLFKHNDFINFSHTLLEYLHDNNSHTLKLMDSANNILSHNIR